MTDTAEIDRPADLHPDDSAIIAQLIRAECVARACAAAHLEEAERLDAELRRRGAR